MQDPLPSFLIPRAPIPPIKNIQEDTVFTEVIYVADGAHAIVYKVTARNERFGTCMPACLKLFREDCISEYNHETTAYALLRRAGVNYYIPTIYGVGRRTPAGWGIDTDTSETEYYGILMEWLEGAERLNSQNITMDHAVTLVMGLTKIHDAGVLHFDTFDRNILVIPGSQRAVWIDFSCAHTEDVIERSFRQEAYHGGGVPINYVLVNFFCVSNLQVYDQATEIAMAKFNRKSLFSTMTISQRSSFVIYAAWILLESFPVLTSSTVQPSRLYGEFDIFLMYIAGCLLYIMLLQVVAVGSLASFSLCGLMMVHQLFSISIALWRFSIGSWHDRLWYSFRVLLIAFCTLVNMNYVAPVLNGVVIGPDRVEISPNREELDSEDYGAL